MTFPKRIIYLANRIRQRGELQEVRARGREMSTQKKHFETNNTVQVRAMASYMYIYSLCIL